jgi:predicted deacetylase
VSPNELPALCVSIHDVAPATACECLQLLRAVRAVADIPLSWLVVPCYHGVAQQPRAYELMLEVLLAEGHELVLHGYTHRDEAPPGRPLAHLLRTVYTQREGEFAALGADQARRRIELGLAWFAERGWPLQGFVAPAWLLSGPARAVLSDFPFTYTSTYSHFHLLRPARSVFSPALVYAARNRVGRALSPPLASLVSRAVSRRALVRLALHPRDARYPGLVRHAQHTIARLLATHAPLTKAGFARRLAGPPTTDPSDHPGPSGHVHSPPSTPDSPSAAHPPSR